MCLLVFPTAVHVGSLKTLYIGSKCGAINGIIFCEDTSLKSACIHMEKHHGATKGAILTMSLTCLAIDHREVTKRQLIN